MRVRVSAVIILENKILLVKHCKHKSSYWLLPGGGVEVGEVISDSLSRELNEELNINVESFELLFVVESISENGQHIIQPTFLINDFDIKNIALGIDPIVCGYNFFYADELRNLTIYPDINDELRILLNSGRKNIGKRYILKKWKS